ncbi:hypothetical protein PHM2_065 [Prochlorococcus phage P-HM2]|uniref:Uncharacterized protein n=1 Tax=Prochlorococcus phage P-HM2 TaxID=445696 RepID=E3SSR5_9CAUD|nr:hypothetical protein PHM2_065 [Prochlorococcus phage P-HM2]ADO99843.1 hypothetical protein PHM2_065 [Prochlorococcus phage P-HM2]
MFILIVYYMDTAYTTTYVPLILLSHCCLHSVPAAYTIKDVSE